MIVAFLLISIMRSMETSLAFNYAAQNANVAPRRHLHRASPDHNTFDQIGSASDSYTASNRSHHLRSARQRRLQQQIDGLGLVDLIEKRHKHVINDRDVETPSYYKPPAGAGAGIMPANSDVTSSPTTNLKQSLTHPPMVDMSTTAEPNTSSPGVLPTVRPVPSPSIKPSPGPTARSPTPTPASNPEAPTEATRSPSQAPNGEVATIEYRTQPPSEEPTISPNNVATARPTNQPVNIPTSSSTVGDSAQEAPATDPLTVNNDGDCDDEDDDEVATQVVTLINAPNKGGVFGEISTTVRNVQLSYELEVTANGLTTGGTVQRHIIPALEEKIVHILLMSFLPAATSMDVSNPSSGGGGGGNSGEKKQCGNRKKQRLLSGYEKGLQRHRSVQVASGGGENSESPVVGAMPYPTDRIVPDESCTVVEPQGANDCVPVQGGMVVFLRDDLDSSQQDAVSLDILTHIRTNMNKDKYVDADPAIVRVAFVDSTISNPFGGSDKDDIGFVVRKDREPVKTLPFVVVGVATALLASLLLLVLRRRRGRKEGNEDGSDPEHDPRDKDLGGGGDFETSIAPSSTAADLTMASTTSFTRSMSVDSFPNGLSFDSQSVTSASRITTPTSSPKNVLALTPMLGNFEDDGTSTIQDDDSELLFSPIGSQVDRSDEGKAANSSVFTIDTPPADRSRKQLTPSVLNESTDGFRFVGSETKAASSIDHTNKNQQTQVLASMGVPATPERRDWERQREQDLIKRHTPHRTIPLSLSLSFDTTPSQTIPLSLSIDTTPSRG